MVVSGGTCGSPSHVGFPVPSASFTSNWHWSPAQPRPLLPAGVRRRSATETPSTTCTGEELSVGPFGASVHSLLNRSCSEPSWSGRWAAAPLPAAFSSGGRARGDQSAGEQGAGGGAATASTFFGASSRGRGAAGGAGS